MCTHSLELLTLRKFILPYCSQSMTAMSNSRPEITMPLKTICMSHSPLMDLVSPEN